MWTLFLAMMKEEWRIHSTLFGSVSFVLFPVLIFAISAMSSLLLPLIRSTLPAGSAIASVVSVFVVMGMMVGGFGLLGKEVMNRRFGQASLLSYSARTLPLSGRSIFFWFVAKDIVFYFFLWIFPFSAGFIAVSPFTGFSLSTGLSLLLAISLSFLTGLAGVFFLSVVYSRSKPALVVLLIAGAAAWWAVWIPAAGNPLAFFPPILVFASFSFPALIAALILVLVPVSLAFVLFTPEYPDTERSYPDRFTRLSRSIGFFPFPALNAKDFLDLFRSGAGIGQTLFSLVLPLGIIWFFLSLTSSFLPPGAIIVSFAVISGIISSTMFGWITEFDSFSAYTCLPVGVGHLITSKAGTYAVLQVLPALVVTVITLASGNARYLPFSLVVWVSLSFYCLGVIVYLMGLSPNVMLYDAKVFLSYLVLTGLPALILAGLGMTDPLLLLAAPLLFLPATVFFRKGRQKWAARDSPGF